MHTAIRPRKSFDRVALIYLSYDRARKLSPYPEGECVHAGRVQCGNRDDAHALSVAYTRTTIRQRVVEAFRTKRDWRHVYSVCEHERALALAFQSRIS